MVSIPKNLLVYGGAHAVVDLASAITMYSIFRTGVVSAETFFFFLLAYDFLAFAGQAVLGWFVDKVRAPRAAAMVGCLLVAISLFTWQIFPMLSVILAGLGNALFHLGGGAISLNLMPGRAAAPGLFVAPGAVGLATGILAGQKGDWSLFWVAALLVLSTGLIFLTKSPTIDYEKKPAVASRKMFTVIFILLFSSIIIRSFVGSIVAYPWKKDAALFWTLILAVFLGKALGGVLADKFGWIRVSVGALMISAVLIPFGFKIPILGIAGMFFFQFVMAVILAALAFLIPGRSALIFGLNCLALFFGLFPFFFPESSVIFLPHWQGLAFGATLCSSVAIYFSLVYLEARRPRDIIKNTF